jgi:hypothetical protein
MLLSPVKDEETAAWKISVLWQGPHRAGRGRPDIWNVLYYHMAAWGTGSLEKPHKIVVLGDVFTVSKKLKKEVISVSK